MMAQAADDPQPLVIAADYNSTWSGCAKMIGRFHFTLSTWLGLARRNAHRRSTLSCSRDVLTERARREVVSRANIHQRAITPIRRRTEEMQSRDRRLKVSVQNRKGTDPAH